MLGQADVEEGDLLEVALAMPQRILLEGKLVTLDAGLLQKCVVDAVLEKGETCLAVLKGNHGEVTEAVNYWWTRLRARRCPTP